MEQRSSLITLGVRDMDCAARVYEKLDRQRIETLDGVIACDRHIRENAYNAGARLSEIGAFRWNGFG